jgi:GNAT superfamily N-acetyltransferase
VRIDQVQDVAALEAFHVAEAAAHDHDFVALPADPVPELLPLLDGREQAGELVLLWVARVGDAPVGGITLSLPTLDNLTAASLDLFVHPEHRRRGHGRALLGFALEQVRARGRGRVYVEVPSPLDGPDGPGGPLLRAVGGRPVLEDLRRLLDLGRHPVGTPLPPPEGYRVVQWVDRAPDEVVDGAAYLTGRMMLDAPLGEMDYEPERWDAVRYREKEQLAVARDRQRVATAVVHAETGAAAHTVAGITDIGVGRSAPRVAYQWDTIVDPDHRGRRLGMVLKSWNHQQLVQQVPGVAYVNTWNAASNSFMIAVNEELGFEVADRWTEWQLDL